MTSLKNKKRNSRNNAFKNLLILCISIKSYGIKLNSYFRNTTSNNDDRDKSRERDRSRRIDRPHRVNSNSRDRSRERSERSRKVADRRIYVSNIPYDFRWQDLKDLFRTEVGKVAHVELFTDESEKPRGCGIVEFEDSDSVKIAVEKMHRFDIKGRKLVVKEVMISHFIYNSSVHL